MKKRILKKLGVLVLALVLMLSLSPTVMAASGSITSKGVEVSGNSIRAYATYEGATPGAYITVVLWLNGEAACSIETTKADYSGTGYTTYIQMFPGTNASNYTAQAFIQ